MEHLEGVHNAAAYAISGVDGSISPFDPEMGPLNPSPSGAGAAVLFSPTEVELGHAARPAGSYACSYSAEVRGAEAGLVDLVPLLPPDCTHLLWVTDSRSLLQALEKGCLRQTAFAEAAIWHALLRLSERGIGVSCVWVFSHTDSVPCNDRADQLASTAADELRGSTAPLWWVDAARHRWSPKLQEYLKSCTDPSRTFEPPRLSLTHLSLFPTHQRLLSCLRAGVWEPLGYEVGGTRACPLCGDPSVPHRRGGIQHMLSCPGAIDYRPQPFVEGDLWSPSIALQKSVVQYALKYKELLVGPHP